MAQSIAQYKLAMKMGWRRALSQLLRESDIRGGTLVGEDQFGNKYYERPDHVFGLNRWVDYAKEKHYYCYDGSKIPPEWHRWIHNMCQEPPQSDPKMLYRPFFQEAYQPNPTGTAKAYMPWSTTKAKIEAWDPNAPAKQ
ncbi:hypothetical protein CAOG_07397 [Capsaspora owczarzaki ATCC 30864]|uniref:NADH dehydrogenase [ubiquinone] 1 alpha subcomplex subunit 12 n=1 Tax=Capsaspora owczarzaki (strain ATCC 30864) TaxID=595528 RepID=A0A0D2WWX2_CAPO3|nr:hypothetical protein CAOG_07397 [Capsaspora owczarzaki ATCC 30864]KJE97560.1 hypothetical protein CAOG_007397 [Capsaspora owczarzaki ATCC 30864]|eukprot:XP_004343256.1 hypothetical protein CAOG_07397 [Capsaspora owczarzaki ATCC 30864]